MRIGVLLPTNVYFSPYSRVYTDLLDELGVDYDIIYFDKRNLNELAAHRFSASLSSTDGMFKRFLGYYRYSRFLAKVIRKERYDRLIVCGPQIAIFLYPFLKKYYSGKFIMDYRDLSIERWFMPIYRKVLSISSYNMISSPGFKRCLPEGVKYILSHNISHSLLCNALNTPPESISNSWTLTQGKISVLTIGGIRDFEQNAAIMMALANDQRFETSYIGRGEEGADVKLKELAASENIHNVNFSGFYQKHEEPDIIKRATFLNIFYPHKLSHDTALSNRFYSSLIFRKPMITTVHSIQGDYVQDYGVGIAIENTDNLKEELNNFIAHHNIDDYEANRRKLLQSFMKDYETFKKAVIEFSKT